MPLPLVGVAVAFLAVAGWQVWPLKDVDTDGRWLFVHGATKDARVLLEAVREVRLVRRMRGPRVAVTFDTQPASGRRVLLQPTLDWMATRERGQQGGRAH